MEWQDYWGILRRRWILIAAVILVDLLASGYLYARAAKKAGYQACTTLYVADVSAPTLITAPQTTLQGLGQLLAGETAANFFGDDVLDVAGSQHVARYVSSQLANTSSTASLPSSAVGDINGSVSGARRDRTVSLCVTNPSSDTALAAARVLGSAMTVHRAEFLGTKIAARTYVAVVSDASVARTPVSQSRLSLALRFILGVIVAIGLALLWDVLDPRVRDRRDVERALGVPVLA